MHGKSFDEMMEVAYGVKLRSLEAMKLEPLVADLPTAPWRPARWWLTQVAHILLTLAFIQTQVDAAINRVNIGAQFILDFLWLIVLPSAIVAAILAKFLHKRGFGWYHLFSLLVFLYVSIGMVVVSYVNLMSG